MNKRTIFILLLSIVTTTLCNAQGHIFKRDTNNVNIISVGFNEWPTKKQWKYIDAFLNGTQYLYSINLLKGKKNKNIFLKLSLNGNYGNVESKNLDSKVYSLFPQIGIRYQKKLFKSVPMAFYSDALMGYHYGYTATINKTYLNQTNTKHVFWGGGVNFGVNWLLKNIFVGCDFGFFATKTKTRIEYIIGNDVNTFVSNRVLFWPNSIGGLKIGFKLY